MTKAARRKAPEKPETLAVESTEAIEDTKPTATLEVPEPDRAPEGELDRETQLSGEIDELLAKVQTVEDVREEIAAMATRIMDALFKAAEALGQPLAEIRKRLDAIEKAQTIILAPYDISDENKAWLESASAQLNVRIGQIVDEFVTERRSWSPSTRLAKIEGEISDRVAALAQGRGWTFSDVITKGVLVAEEVSRL